MAGRMVYHPPKSRAITINYEQVRLNIDNWAKEAVDRGLEEARERAKERAPVRDVFKGGRQRRGPEVVPRGTFATLASGKVVPRKNIYHKSVASQQLFLDRVGRQAGPDREVRIPKRSGDKQKYYRRVRGNYRSWNYDPDAPRSARSRVASRGLVLGTRSNPFAGPFRRLSIGDDGTIDFKPVTRYDRKGSRLQLPDETRDLLSSRGARELDRLNLAIQQAARTRGRGFSRSEVLTMLRASEKSGRAGGRGTQRPTVRIDEKGVRRMARTSAVTIGPRGEITLGGRLRNEIYRTEVKSSGGYIYGEVVSPTYYARYQEYGTSHNRATPYMRPALYEMRQRLPQIFKTQVSRARGGVTG